MDKSNLKRKVLQQLKKAMMSDEDFGDLGKKLKGNQKVTVMSDSKEGLEKGLDKAQEILKKRSSMMEPAESSDKKKMLKELLADEEE